MNTDTNETKINRRSFLQVIGWGSLFTTIVISVIGTFRFMFPSVLFEEPSVFTIGSLEEFKNENNADSNNVCKVYENWKQDQSVWIVREQDRIYAVHSKCTHLGCTPNWFEDEGVFKCPCHGSQFDSNGVNFAGPAPRPLDRFSLYKDDAGKISIDKSKIYTYKNFDKPGAYLEV